MTTQLHDTGEEWLIDTAFASDPGTTTLAVGLYNDGSDGLADNSDEPDILTEPAGGAYGRQSVSIGSNFTAGDNSGNWEAIMDDVTFDTSDSSQSVDAYFVVVNFDSDDAGDAGTPTDHLLFTGSLDQTYDLGSVDSFSLSGSGISIN